MHSTILDMIMSSGIIHMVLQLSEHNGNLVEILGVL